MKAILSEIFHTQLQQRHYKILVSQAPLIKKRKGKESFIRTQSPVKTLRAQAPGRKQRGRTVQDSKARPPQPGGTASVSRNPARAASRPRTATCWLRPLPGPRLKGAAARYTQRVSAAWAGPASWLHLPARSSPCSLGGRGEPGREEDENEGCRNGGIRLALHRPWRPAFPRATAVPGHATVRLGTATARALILFRCFPPDLPRAHAPPPTPEDSWSRSAPYPPLPVRENGTAFSSRERLPLPLPLPPPAPASECANEKGGGRFRRKHCRRHYPLFLCCTDLDVLPTSRLFAAYR